MWELITSRMPFWDQNNDIELIIKICKDFHPSTIKNTPKGYIELMQEYWDSDLNIKPTTSNIFVKLIQMERFEEENLTEIIKSSNIGSKITDNSNKSRSLNKIIKSASITLGK